LNNIPSYKNGGLLFPGRLANYAHLADHANSFLKIRRIYRV